MLNVNEIYAAICGESRFSGRPCTLVRLAGCHQRCVWCDSAHAFPAGGAVPRDQVHREIANYGWPTVLVTGGEPLLQPEALLLMGDLLADGRTVLLETSGTLLPAGGARLMDVPAGVHRIVDLKAPGSGVDAADLDWEGIARLHAADDLKIVVADRADYVWARGLLRTGRLPEAVPVLLSPVHGVMDARELAEWILEDGLHVRLQVQLHKLVWSPSARGV